MAVDQVELVDVGQQELQRRLHVRQRVAGVAGRAERLRHGLDEPARHHGVAAGERGDVVAAAVQLGDESMDDPLGAAVGERRDTLERRCDLGDAKGT